ncbi:hypothetical protein SAMN05444678_102342 [Sphingomonas sp. YR710]|jgi:hypothetical protein|nr:hypothetical protein SAMN05444678_102342 [Sphingomonas sp. YR710]
MGVSSEGFVPAAEIRFHDSSTAASTARLPVDNGNGINDSATLNGFAGVKLLATGPTVNKPRFAAAYYSINFLKES